MPRRPTDFLPIGPQQIGLRAGDRLPSLVMQIIDDRAEPVDLTDARVYLSVRRLTGVPRAGEEWSEWQLGRQVLIIGDPVEGTVYYDLQPYDTWTNPGDFEIVLVVRFADGEEVTAPTIPNATITLRDALITDVTEAYLRLSDDTILGTKDDVPLVVQIDASVAPEIPAFQVPEQSSAPLMT